MNFRFAAPWALALLLPPAGAAWRMLRRPRKPAALPFAAVRFLPPRTSGWRHAVARAIPFVFTAGAFLLIVAAARPQTFFSRERRSVDAIAIAMTVDVSGSMAALDMASNPQLPGAPTRLDVVKEEFRNFVERRPDDLITLVTFGGYASTRCPLTADRRAVMRFLEAVQIPGYGDDDGQNDSEETLTAIGDGLTTACARLQEAEVKSKVVVLLSDGVSNTGVVKPDRAAEIAKELGIKVYTIGIGAKNGLAPFRTGRGLGSIAMGRVEFDAAELQNIARTTGGRYYGVRDRDGLDKVLEEIDALEKTRVERDVFNNYTERFAAPLVAGTALAALAAAAGLVCLHRPL